MSLVSDICIQEITFERLKNSSIKLKMARLDQNNALASGNKIYKLKPIIKYAKAHNFKQILSFGGAYSNHIHALALLAKQYQIESIALIRGEAEYAQNPTLSDAQNAGMQLQFVNRAEYKQRNDEAYLKQLQQRFPDALIVPEGGSSQLAIHGCAQMARDINQFSSNELLAIASGTGATAAGLVCGLAENQRLNVYAVLKDESLPSRIADFIDKENDSSKQIHQQYSLHKADFGGYAKLDQSLLDFILDWLAQTGILLDPIYTSKMCLRVVQQIEAGEFSKGQSMTLIHSGGLQGWRGMQQRVESLVGAAAWKMINNALQ